MKVLKNSTYGSLSGEIGTEIVNIQSYLIAEMLTAGIELSEEKEIRRTDLDLIKFKSPYDILDSLDNQSYHLIFNFQRELTTPQQNSILNLFGYQLPYLVEEYNNWGLELVKSNPSESVWSLSFHYKSRLEVKLYANLFLNEIREQKLKKLLHD